MNRIREDPRKYMEKIQKLTGQIESLNSKNNSLTQQVNRFQNMPAIHAKLKQTAMYYRDKYQSVSNMIERLKKEVRQTGNWGEEASEETEINTSQKCSVCEETQQVEESIKDKFESMTGHYKVIKRFTVKKAAKKNLRKVETICICREWSFIQYHNVL